MSLFDASRSLDHARDRHVEDRVVERDDQQRDAQRGEDQPAPVRGPWVDRVLPAPSSRGVATRILLCRRRRSDSRRRLSETERISIVKFTIARDVEPNRCDLGRSRSHGVGPPPNLTADDRRHRTAALDLRLTEWTSCGGCAAKWGASVLAEMVAELPPAVDPALLVGLAPFDDAAIYRIDDHDARWCRRPTSSRRSSTTRPTTAPSPRPTRAATSTRWAAASCWRSTWRRSPSTSRAPRWRRSSTPPPPSWPRPAGRSPAGTRSATRSRCSASPCRASCTPTACSARAGAPAGDVVVLSKPLGTGLTLAGGTDDDKAAAIAGMRALNRVASERLQALGDVVHAVTDVTGYGLAGHGWEVAERSRRAARHRRSAGSSPTRVPSRRPSAGVRTGGDARNRDYVAGHLDSTGVGDGRGAGARPPDVGRPARRRRSGGRGRADRRRVLAGRRHRGRRSGGAAAMTLVRRPIRRRLEEAGADAVGREGDVGPRPRRRRRHRRGRSRLVGRSADGRRRDPAPRHPGQRGP